MDIYDKKVRSNAVAVALVAVILIAGCGSSSGVTIERSPLESAKLAYVDASIAYETAMVTLQDLRRNRQLTDAQWARIDAAQHVVQQFAPMVEEALEVWQSSGSKPQTFDSTFTRLVGAFMEAQKILKEARP